MGWGRGDHRSHHCLDRTHELAAALLSSLSELHAQLVSLKAGPGASREEAVEMPKQKAAESEDLTEWTQWHTPVMKRCGA